MRAANRFDNFDFPSSLLSIECVTYNLNSWEAKNAYLKLIKSKARNYLDSEKNSSETEIINREISRLCELQKIITEELKFERKTFYPLGKQFDNEVIEIELCNYPTYDGQMTYLQKKLKLFDELTINLPKNEYSDIRANLKTLIKKRKEYLKTYYSDTYFDFNLADIIGYIKSIRKRERLDYLLKVIEQVKIITENLYKLERGVILIDEVEAINPKIAPRFIELYKEYETLWEYLKCNENSINRKSKSIGEFREKRKRHSELKKIFESIKELPELLVYKFPELNEFDIPTVDKSVKIDKMVWYGERRDFVALTEGLIISKKLKLPTNKYKYLSQIYTWHDEEMTAKHLKDINSNLNRKDRTYYPTEEMEKFMSDFGIND